MTVPVKRFLIIRLSSFGDIVLTTPVLAFIKNHFPQSSIDFVTYHHFSEVIRFHPDIDTVYTFDKRKFVCLLRNRRFLHAARLWHSFVKALKSKHYDCIVDLHSVTDSAIVALKAQGRVRICNSHQLLGLLFSKTYSFPLKNEDARSHAINYNVSSLQALGVFPTTANFTTPPPPAILFPRESLQRAGLLLTGINPGQKPLVGINPEASRSFKCWNEERFAVLIDMICERFGFMVVLTGKNRMLLSRIHDHTKSKPPILPNCDTLVAFALITRFDFFITNDSGPMHIAAAYDIPQLALFGHSNHVKFSPCSMSSVLIRTDVSCSPCSEESARQCSSRLCLSGITTEKVFTEFSRLVELHPITDPRSRVP